MNIGKAISNIRLSNNIARSDLALKVGISASYLGQIENGTTPSINVLSKIADFFKVPLPVLMWFSIEDKDIHISKKQIFSYFKVPINSMMIDLIKNNQQTITFDNEKDINN